MRSISPNHLSLLKFSTCSANHSLRQSSFRQTIEFMRKCSNHFQPIFRRLVSCKELLFLICFQHTSTTYLLFHMVSCSNTLMTLLLVSLFPELGISPFFPNTCISPVICPIYIYLYIFIQLTGFLRMIAHF